jgi:curli biogenesis system outer membrane secretion channel CsgG
MMNVSYRFYTRQKGGNMNTYKKLAVGCLLVAAISLVLAGCASPPGQPIAEVTQTQGPSIAEARAVPYSGSKARIAVGDFQVKAGGGATAVIGDGMREMLVTALFNSNRFIVLERQAMKDILLEQDLGSSRRVVKETAAPIGRLEGVELMAYGVVSEFAMGASGVGLNIGLPNVPLQFGGGAKNAHVAIDLRLVDTATGRILFATRVQGKATDYSTSVGTTFGQGRTVMPVTLKTFQNTPMEKAIRVCIDQAVGYLCTQTPASYFQPE